MSEQKIAELEERIASLEERMATLEGQPTAVEVVDELNKGIRQAKRGGVYSGG